MSHDKWTELDLYHGIVDKIQQMIVEGKFSAYVYKFQNKLIRGNNIEMVKSKSRIIQFQESFVEKKVFKFEFCVIQEHPDSTPEEEKFNKLDVPLNVEFVRKFGFFSEPDTEDDYHEQFPKLKISLFGEYGNFVFQWKDLWAKGVDLDTVLHHYFEKCYLEVPPGHTPPESFYSLPGDETMCILKINFDAKKNYEEIVKYYESSLSFAMSQHKRLGQACLYWDLPDTCLALIHLLLRPQFGKLP